MAWKKRGNPGCSCCAGPHCESPATVTVCARDVCNSYAPIPGATVTASSDATTVTGTTGGDGCVTLTLPKEGTYQVTVDTPGCYTTQARGQAQNASTRSTFRLDAACGTTATLYANHYCTPNSRWRFCVSKCGPPGGDTITLSGKVNAAGQTGSDGCWYYTPPEDHAGTVTVVASNPPKYLSRSTTFTATTCGGVSVNLGTLQPAAGYVCCGSGGTDVLIPKGQLYLTDGSGTYVGTFGTTWAWCATAKGVSNAWFDPASRYRPYGPCPGPKICYDTDDGGNAIPYLQPGTPGSGRFAPATPGPGDVAIYYTMACPAIGSRKFRLVAYVAKSGTFLFNPNYANDGCCSQTGSCYAWRLVTLDAGCGSDLRSHWAYTAEAEPDSRDPFSIRFTLPDPPNPGFLGGTINPSSTCGSPELMGLPVFREVVVSS